jgi:hypothetical protein
LGLGIKHCDPEVDCAFHPYREQAIIGSIYSSPLPGGNYTCHVTTKYLPNDIRIVTQIHIGGYYRYTDYFDLKKEDMGGQDINRSFTGSWANDGFFLFQAVSYCLGDRNPQWHSVKHCCFSI